MSVHIINSKQCIIDDKYLFSEYKLVVVTCEHPVCVLE